jgi:predicted nuclease of predicted toxin-antitoxin system
VKFKIDENLPLEFAAILQRAGFETDTIADEDLSGAADALLAQHARTNHRVLITLDMDFAISSLILRLPMPASWYFGRTPKTR